MIQKLARDLFRLIYPRFCPGCGADLVGGEEEVCISCLTDIEQTRFHLKGEENELYYRFAGKVPMHSAAAFYYFDKAGKMQRIISALKYENSPRIGRSLGRIYGSLLAGSTFIQDFEAVAPVPLHRDRLVERGYNQSHEFCRGLCEKTGLRLMPDALERRAATRSQTKKGREERFANMKDVFRARKPVSGGLLLADDVVTTGATLEACIRALYAQENPPSRVGVIAIAMTRSHV